MVGTLCKSTLHSLGVTNVETDRLRSTTFTMRLFTVDHLIFIRNSATSRLSMKTILLVAPR
jgi:hypothetical protein